MNLLETEIHAYIAMDERELWVPTCVLWTLCYHRKSREYYGFLHIL